MDTVVYMAPGQSIVKHPDGWTIRDYDRDGNPRVAFIRKQDINK